MEEKRRQTLLHVTFWLLIIGICLFFLIYFKKFLLPVVLAIVIWYIIKDVRRYIARIKIAGKMLPKIIRNLIAFGLIMSLVLVTIEIISLNVRAMMEKFPEYNIRMDRILGDDNPLFSNSNLADEVQNFDVKSLVRNAVSIFTNLVGHFFLFMLYVILLLIEESMFLKKIYLLKIDDAKRERLIHIFSKVNDAVHRYISIKTIASLLTGTLSYIVLLIVGVDFPAFWAFLIFLFNFIPSVGSIIATLFPAIFSVFQFNDFSHFFIIFLSVAGVQLFVGNFLEPRLMGKTLNLSPFVVLISLTFWGVVWGPVGMLLSVPITSIIVIILAQFEETQNIVTMVSGNGKITQT